MLGKEPEELPISLGDMIYAKRSPNIASYNLDSLDSYSFFIDHLPSLSLWPPCLCGEAFGLRLGCSAFIGGFILRSLLIQTADKKTWER